MKATLILQPVAILDDEDFDVTTVDIGTVKFRPCGAYSQEWIKGLTIIYEDVNLDGYSDLVLHFKTRETGILHGDVEADLIGWIMYGVPFAGSDSIRTIPK